uniref:DUF1618 domain-containing protein n=2 Tax=Setaria viridis TaxID=4556 RepID=A0A4U6VBP0_SETVI|nr:uncharacterized protein LOC117847831 [Setaria viridis]TKW26811.1 hypothetical protein SEVIR_3G215900v2 [Setaria viridis]
MVSATSGDGLLLLDFTDARGTAPIVDTPGGRCRKLIGLDLDPDVTRFVCNPLSGQLLRLPDIDGTKKTASSNNFGILTRSAHGHGPPDRYVVAELRDDRDAEEGSFVMRRFFPETGVWEKLVGLPSPLPLPRRMDIYHEVLAFAGRLWWVDLSWGAVSADPFSDRPELSFVELPSASVLPVPSTIAEYDAAREVQGVYRRLGVSEGRLRYVELSQKMPFLLSSFVLDEDGRSWTLEHQMALGVLWEKIDPPPEEHYPRIGVVDPLNSSLMYVTIGNLALAVDMGRVLVRGSLIDEPGAVASTLFLKPCVLPPWLRSSRIPSAGTLSSNKDNTRSKTLSDILVRADRDKKN